MAVKVAVWSMGKPEVRYDGEQHASLAREIAQALKRNAFYLFSPQMEQYSMNSAGED